MLGLFEPRHRRVKDEREVRYFYTKYGANAPTVLCDWANRRPADFCRWPADRGSVTAGPVPRNRPKEPSRSELAIAASSAWSGPLLSRTAGRRLERSANGFRPRQKSRQGKAG